MKRCELYQTFKEKASKIRKKYLKNQKFSKISIDSVRGFLNYRQLKIFLNDKTFSDLYDDKHNVVFFKIVGTGIKVKVIAKDAKIYYEAFAMSQYYATDNDKNREKLEKLLLNTHISSVDIAFDSNKMIQLHACATKRLSTTTYYEPRTPKIAKICSYDKTRKTIATNHSFKNLNQSARKQIYRAEFTILNDRKHLNKNKLLKRPHSKSRRIKGAQARLSSLIDNYYNINITYNSELKKIQKTNSLKKRIKEIYLKYSKKLSGKNSKNIKKLNLILTKIKI